MQTPDGSDRPEDQGNPQIISPGDVGSGQSRPIGELLGKAKRKVARPSGKGERTVDPRRAWSDERRAAASAKQRETWAARKATSSTADGSDTPEAILEVKPEPAEQKPAPPINPKDAAQLGELCYIGHMFFAKSFRIYELQLTHDEARDLTIASMNVARHYDVGKMTEKMKDWLILFGVGSMTYGPKLQAAKIRVAGARKAKMAPEPGLNEAGGYTPAQDPMTQEVVQ